MESELAHKETLHQPFLGLLKVQDYTSMRMKSSIMSEAEYLFCRHGCKRRQKSAEETTSSLSRHLASLK